MKCCPTLSLLGPYPAARLCFINLLFYLCIAWLVFDAITRSIFAVTVHGAVLDSILFAFIFLINPFIWFALRAYFSQQVRVASNARRVLRTMTTAATLTSRALESSRGSAKRIAELPEDARESFKSRAAHTIEALLADIVWLPCYDKRDVLVIRELISSGCGVQALTPYAPWPSPLTRLRVCVLLPAIALHN